MKSPDIVIEVDEIRFIDERGMGCSTGAHQLEITVGNSWLWPVEIVAISRQDPKGPALARTQLGHLSLTKKAALELAAALTVLCITD